MHSVLTSQLVLWIGLFNFARASAFQPPRGFGSDPSFLSRRQRSSTPCGKVTTAQVLLGAEYVEPSAALGCLNSVPLDGPRDLAFIDFAVPYINFQSNLAYLKDPPANYKKTTGAAGVDILGGIADIRQQVTKNLYKNQYEFTVALQELVDSAKDSHFSLTGALTYILSFQRDVALVSVSSDGLSPPKVYEQGDLVQSLSRGYQASPVAKLDGVPVDEYLDGLARSLRVTDADASYNMLFPSLGKIAAASSDIFGGGTYTSLPDTTILELANGTSLTFRNVAVPQIDFSGIYSGQDLHEAVEVTGPLEKRSGDSSSAPTPSLEEPALSARAAAACTPNVDPAQLQRSRANWPKPFDQHFDGYASGYFLNGSGYSDTAVLQIASFESPYSPGDAAASRCDYGEFHRLLVSFVSQFHAAGKKRLILDLRSNGGGAEATLSDAFLQLFPGVSNTFLWRTRATSAYSWMGNATFSQNANVSSPFAITFTGLRDPGPVTAGTKPSAQATYYPTWPAFFGPDTDPVLPHSDNFTRLSSRDLRTERLRYGIDSSGPTTPLVADPRTDVVLLTDGDCHSSCALFAGWVMRDLGARAVVVGGRPNGDAPMQAIGGTKGGGAYSWDNFQAMERLALDMLGKREDAMPPGLGLPSLGPPPLNIVNRFLNTMDVWREDLFDVPLQFVYEAANCRLFYTAKTLMSLDEMWKAVADVAWNGAKCVKGSAATADDSMGPDRAKAAAKREESTMKSAGQPVERRNEATAGAVAWDQVALRGTVVVEGKRAGRSWHGMGVVMPKKLVDARKNTWGWGLV